MNSNPNRTGRGRAYIPRLVLREFSTWRANREGELAWRPDWVSIFAVGVAAIMVLLFAMKAVNQCFQEEEGKARLEERTLPIEKHNQPSP